MDFGKVLELTNARHRIVLYEMRLDAVLDKTQRVINRGDARMTDLARFLGKNWNQCHEWIVKRNHVPNAEVALGMMHFTAINDKSSGRIISYDQESKEMTIDGKKLSDVEHDLWMENNMLKTLMASDYGKKT